MSECEYCSGSGCVYCKAEPEKVEAPKIVEARFNFTEIEVGELFIKDKDEAVIMARYLNSRCSFNRTCPLLRSKCVTDCPCFKEAEVSSRSKCEPLRPGETVSIESNGFYISGFRCGNLMFGLG